MCGGPERIKPSEDPSPPSPHNPSMRTPLRHLSLDIPDPVPFPFPFPAPSPPSPSLLLELAANNDAAALRRLLLSPSPSPSPSSAAAAAAADEEAVWYGRRKGSTQMVRELRTPLMVAATYGSVDALALLVSLPSVDVNRRSSSDSSTALHCAASSASPAAPSAVRLLLSSGADPSSLDSLGRLPSDLVLSPPHLPDLKPTLLRLLLRSPKNDFAAAPAPAPAPAAPAAADPSVPDIKNSIYATDDFRMYSFKVRPCSRAYSHDWTECPFVHPGENARRRDPRKYHYSCMPCPDFRKGACRRGDMCEYAHGVFECWLHPAQYRTRICKDGPACARRVCFFAHTPDELRPLYVSTGSAVPSPRSSVELAAAAAAGINLMPGSPSSVMSPFTPPLSPSSAPNGMGQHSSLGWQPQPNVPALHLPGSVLQSSRLRASLSARDMQVEEFSLMMPDYDYDAQMLNDLSHSRLGSSAGNRMARSRTLNPSNLDDLFSAEIASSPNYNSDQGSIFLPGHKNAILHQFQQQQQNMLSPSNTSVFSPKAVEAQQLPVHSSLLQASLGICSPGRMSPRTAETISPMSSHFATLAQREKQQQQTLTSLSSRDLGSGTSLIVGSPANSSWPNWGSSSQAPDWEVNGEELGRLRRSSSFELRLGGEEPDLSWVHSLVRESPPEKPVGAGSAHSPAGHPNLTPANVIPGEDSNLNPRMGGLDQATVVGALLEQMQLERKAVQ